MVVPVNQAVSSGASAANQNITYSVTPGNSLVLLYARSGGLATGAITSITDTNTWAVVTRGAVSGGTNTRIEMWLCSGASSSGTMTVNSAAAQTAAWNLIEWPGLLTVDVASPDNSSAASSTSVSSPNLTGLTGTADLVIAAAHFAQTTAALAAGSLYSPLSDFDDGTAGSGRAAYQNLTAGGSVNGATWSPLGTARAAGVITAAFITTPSRPPLLVTRAALIRASVY